MKTGSPFLIAEHSPLPERQFEWFMLFFHVVFIGGLAVTLVLHWQSPENTSALEAVFLTALVAFQSALYLLMFALPGAQERWLDWRKIAFYFIGSAAAYFIECRIGGAFQWVLAPYLGQIFSLPLRIALPGAAALVAGFLLTVIGWNRLAQFSFFEWVISLGSTVALAGFLLFLHRAAATSRDRSFLIANLEAARRDLEQARQHDAELGALRERERLARDLHDNLGHSLAAMTVHLEALQRVLPPDAARAAALAAEMQALTRGGMEELRRSLANLRAPGLNGRAPAVSLRELCAESARRSGIAVECVVDENVDRLPPAVGEAFWRVAQEGLMNAEKHSQARNVRLELTLASREALLRLSDDGIGLARGATDKPGHFGLRGMRERAEGLGGNFTLAANRGKGTMLEVRIPIVA